LKIEYQQYGKPPGQTSVQQRTPWPGGGRTPLSSERECHPLGRPMAGPSAL